MCASSLIIGFLILGLTIPSWAQDSHPDIPKAWDDNAVEGLEVPLAQRDRSPRQMRSEQYYKLKVRPIYRSYLVTGREPAGYVDSLKQKDPEIIFDPSKLHSKEDWVAAGKLVFEADIRFFPAAAEPPANARYYIRKKGLLELGTGASCAGCHRREMPDGTSLEGGPSITSLPKAVVLRAKQANPEQLRRRVEILWSTYGAPWVTSRQEIEERYTSEEYAQELAAICCGVIDRQGTSATHPVHIPSLIGAQDRKYLDATGLVRNRSLGDLMRYAILNQGLDTLAHFGDFEPGPTLFGPEEGTRYSDEQLYALALYIYSLKPPPNPNKFDEHASHGQIIFQEQGCESCHTPPLYTNNKLTPALGFKIPDDLRKTDDILDICVGTDPYLALKTRRGTGFYKVPSLQGVWFRSAFGHGGQANTLEEWLDPARLNPDYVPKGFHMGSGPIQGHPFGLNLSTPDKQDLIAFLRTL
jgi:mono/diheme cytochrome c family protein